MIMANWLKILYALPGVLLLALALGELFFTGGQLPLTAKFLGQEKENLLRQQKLLDQAVVRNQELAATLSHLQNFRRNASFVPLEQAQRQLREILESAAAASGMEIRSLSVNRQSAVTETLSLLELALVTECSTEEFWTFATILAKQKPAIYWRVLNIRSNPSTQVARIAVSATVCVLHFSVPPSEGVQ